MIKLLCKLCDNKHVILNKIQWIFLGNNEREMMMWALEKIIPAPSQESIREVKRGYKNRVDAVLVYLQATSLVLASSKCRRHNPGAIASF